MKYHIVNFFREIWMKHSVCFIYIGAAKRGRTKFQAMDEIHEHKVFIKCLLMLFFNRFSKNYTLRLIVFKSREIFSLKIIPLGISQTDLKIIIVIEFMYCMKFRLSSFCSSYINKEYTVSTSKNLPFAWKYSPLNVIFLETFHCNYCEKQTALITGFWRLLSVHLNNSINDN